MISNYQTILKLGSLYFLILPQVAKNSMSIIEFCLMRIIYSVFSFPSDELAPSPQGHIPHLFLSFLKIRVIFL